MKSALKTKWEQRGLSLVLYLVQNVPHPIKGLEHTLPPCASREMESAMHPHPRIDFHIEHQ